MALKSSIHKLAQLDGPEQQKQQILKDLGDLDQYEVLDEMVLIAVYAESNVVSRVKDPTGRIVELVGTDNQTAESRFQGKVGLLVKMGPTAFKYHKNGQPYEGTKPDAGDWVVMNSPHDGREIGMRDINSTGEWVLCRRVPWDLITMRVPDPRVVR